MLDAIVALRERCQRIVSAGGVSLLRPQTRDFLQSALPNTVIALADYQLAGTAYWQQLPDHPDSAIIGGIAVDTEHRKNGICPKMFDRLIAECRSAGMRFAISITAAAGLQRRYRAIGGREDGAECWQGLLETAQQRYAVTGEDDLPQLFWFDVAEYARKLL